MYKRLTGHTIKFCRHHCFLYWDILVHLDISCKLFPGKPGLVFVFVFSSAQTAVRRSNERPENILDIKVGLVLRQRICFLGWVSKNRALTVSPPPFPLPPFP